MEDSNMALDDIHNGLSVLDLYCSVHEYYQEEDTKTSSKQRRRKTSVSRRNMAPSALKKKTPPSRKRSSDYRQYNSDSFLDIRARTSSNSYIPRKNSFGVQSSFIRENERKRSSDDTPLRKNSRRYSLRSGNFKIKGAADVASSLQDHCSNQFDVRGDSRRRKSTGATNFRKTSFDATFSSAQCKLYGKSVCLSPVADIQ